MGDEGQGSHCPSDAQILYVSTSAPQLSHRELGAVGRRGTLLRSQTGKRFQCTCSQILKSHGSRVGVGGLRR